MNKNYVIHWKSRTNGRIGTGKTRFDRDEARRLAEELNREYPEIEHLPVNLEDNGEGDQINPALLAHAISE